MLRVSVPFEWNAHIITLDIRFVRTDDSHSSRNGGIESYGMSNCCSSPSYRRFVEIALSEHNNRTSILNRARIIPVIPSLIARSRFALSTNFSSAFSFVVHELSTIGHVFKLTRDQSPFFCSCFVPRELL